MFLGFFELGDTLSAIIPIAVANVPMDPAVAPNFRVYDGDAIIPNGTGSLAKADTGTITGATNATPIVITSNSHGLQTGAIVKITNVVGTTAANATWSITRTGANTFSLDGSVGNAGYTSGGSWHVCGAYSLSISLTANAGFAVGKTYQVWINWTNSGTNYTTVAYFTVT